jgi:hypothetical protein
MSNETGTTMLTIMPTIRGRSGSAVGIVPSNEQVKAAHEGLVKLNEKGANVTQLVEFLLDLGWSVSPICNMIRYPSDSTRENGHKAGDKLLAQHVNHIKTRWLANKAAKAPAVEPVKEPEAPKAPAVSELRKTN